MLVTISPAKRLDWTGREGVTTEPEFLADASRLAGHARQLSLKALKGLMDLSDDLARLNRERFRDFASDPGDAATRPAIHAFAGDTYRGFDAASLASDGMAWAQDHLRILSGLYGVLRPLDAIQPYRLEMGSRLKTRRGTTLYAYWGDRIAMALNEAAEAVGTGVVVNCASREYFSAVDLKALKPRIVTPEFYEATGGSARMVGVFAKVARGAMARFIVDNRVTTVEGLRDFDLGGYRFVAAEDEDARLIFHRDEDVRN